MKYTKEQFLKAAELAEVSMIDAKHILTCLNDDEKTCGTCQRFKLDGPDFPSLGKCFVGEYHCSRKATDPCDKLDEFKKRK